MLHTHVCNMHTYTLHTQNTCICIQIQKTFCMYVCMHACMFYFTFCFTHNSAFIHVFCIYYVTVFRFRGRVYML